MCGQFYGPGESEDEIEEDYGGVDGEGEKQGVTEAERMLLLMMLMWMLGGIVVRR